MPQETGVIKDTLTGLFCSSYNPVLENCDWSNEQNAVIFPTLPQAEAAAADMNSQIGTDRFIGQHPRPH